MVSWEPGRDTKLRGGSLLSTSALSSLSPPSTNRSKHLFGLYLRQDWVHKLTTRKRHNFFFFVTAPFTMMARNSLAFWVPFGVHMERTIKKKKGRMSGKAVRLVPYPIWHEEIRHKEKTSEMESRELAIINPFSHFCLIDLFYFIRAVDEANTRFHDLCI